MLGPLSGDFTLISHLDTCRGHVCEEDWASEQALEPEGVKPWGEMACVGWGGGHCKKWSS